MDRLPVRVGLQHKNARSFREVGIVFDQLSRRESFHDVTDKNTVFGKFVISMIGYSDVCTRNQDLDLFQGFTHANKLPCDPAPGK
jgi:hypothetical protein